MSNTTLDWQMREALPYLRDDGRLAVLLSYVLHCNERNRAWPSVELLVNETGWGRKAVVEAKKWLIDHSVMEKVPRDKRVDDEAKLHQRVDVMQLTGKMVIDEKTIRLLYANEKTNEEANSAPSELMNFNSVVRKSIPRKSIPTTPEVVSIPKGIAIVEGKDSSEAPAPPPNGNGNGYRERLTAMSEAIASITGDDLKVDQIKRRVGQIAAQLLKAGYTPADVLAFEKWWYKNDWRGQKKQRPTMHQVLSELPRSRAAPTRVNKDYAGESDGAADYVRKMLEERAKAKT